MAEHVRGVWEAEAAAYDAGLMGSRRLMTWEMALVDADPAALLATAAAQPHDAGFVPFVRRAQAAGIPIEIVSDGFGFFIEPALARARRPGAARGHRPDDVRRATRASIAYPNGHPRASCAGPASATGCWPIARPGRAVVFIGDGESDRYAAGYSDVVFAKRSLVRICLEAGWPFQRWTRVRARSTTGWRDDPRRVARRSDDAASRARRRAAARGFFCGPEVWGEGLDDPPEDAWTRT